MDASDGSTDREDIPSSGRSLRQKLGLIINSQKLMVLVVVLVIVDCIVVLLELAIDLTILQLGDNLAFLPPVLSYSGLFILGIFLVEILLRIYVMGLSFFSHKMEVFDAVVVVISFALDLTFGHSDDASAGVGLLIILRLWRVTRIISGVIRSVQTRANREIRKVQRRVNDLESNLIQWQAYSSELEHEIERMRATLREYRADFQARHIPRPGCESTDKPSTCVSERTRLEGSNVDIVTSVLRESQIITIDPVEPHSDNVDMLQNTS
ncbi:unnamed protein product [Candidula unifasciata]|uniref:Voltage-gated hydrogen channel 1 n=1 Tax=Candidula unifasciata TaxID=100452 RepID=A0A8S3ZWK4_9EUPU|nr:unnamed protein product [Candidula unifasciata]